MGFNKTVFTRKSGGLADYFDKYTTTNLYVERAFGADVTEITVVNDSTTDDVQISFDGATLDGELEPGESVTLSTRTRTSVYIKGSAGGDQVRLWGA